jgi:hypothetical protein
VKAFGVNLQALGITQQQMRAHGRQLYAARMAQKQAPGALPMAGTLGQTGA